MKHINRLCKNYIEENFEACVEGGKRELDYLEHSTAKYKGKTIYSLHIPKIFTEISEKVIKDAAETMHGILVKVMRNYFLSEEYRNLFGFSKELEELILNRPEYDSILPICRIDIFLDEENYDFKFCEFNGDGTSSMNEDRELNLAFQQTELYAYLKEHYIIQSYELFDRWALEVKKIFESTGRTVQGSRIAVVDFLEKGCSMYEFEEFCKAFRKIGFEADVCEIRELVYDGTKLTDQNNRKIDVIYRRAVTSDIMEHKEEVKDFISAVKEKNVCLVGDFCTHIMHDKILFQLLRHPMTQAFLEKEEIVFIEKHVPYTRRLTKDVIEEKKLAATKEQWILKPKDSYGAKGVHSGKNHTKEEWKQLLEQLQDTDYLVQEYITPYKSINIDFHKGKEAKMEPYSNLTGLYVYNGSFAGVYSRQSAKEIISTDHDENDIASFVVYEK